MTSEHIDYIAEAIRGSFGNRCPEHADDCPTCKAWKQYDNLKVVPDVPELAPIDAGQTLAGLGVVISQLEIEGREGSLMYLREAVEILTQPIVRYDQAVGVIGGLEGALKNERELSAKKSEQIRHWRNAWHEENDKLAQIKAQEPAFYLWQHPDHENEFVSADSDCKLTDYNKEYGWSDTPLFAAPVDQTAEIERLRVIALSLCDHMEMVANDLFNKNTAHQDINISSMRIAIDEARAALSEKDSS